MQGRVVGQFDCHPEQAAFAPRGIWASRALCFVACPEQAKRVEGRFLRHEKRAFGSLPYQTDPLPHDAVTAITKTAVL